MKNFVEEDEYYLWSGIYVEEEEPNICEDIYRGSNELVDEIISVVGPLISVYVNGELYEEISFLYGYWMGNYLKLFQVVNPGKIEVEKYALKIINIDGSIVEIKPNKNRFLNRKEVKDIVKELSLKGRLKLTKRERDGKLIEQYIELDEKLDGLIKWFKGAFYPDVSRSFFVVEDKSISFNNTCISVE